NIAKLCCGSAVPSARLRAIREHSQSSCRWQPCKQASQRWPPYRSREQFDYSHGSPATAPITERLTLSATRHRAPPRCPARLVASETGLHAIGCTVQPSTTASSCRDSSACDPCGETRLLAATRCTTISHVRPLTGYSRLASEKIPLSN